LAAVLIPPAARLNDHLPSAFLTGETYATMVGIFASVLILVRLDPAHHWRWAIVLGSGVLMETLVRMTKSGPGNVWPVAIFLALFIGWVPSFIAATLGRVLWYRHSTNAPQPDAT
jgi:hypothetical protein